jgi:hypothetical protein
MVGDPRDKTAYSIAIASLGLALLLLIGGICWIAAQPGEPAQVIVHRCALAVPIHCRPEVVVNAATDPPGIPDGLGVALAALGGILVGALIPFPPLGTPPKEWMPELRAWALVLAVVCVVLVALTAVIAQNVSNQSLAWCATGGVLLGLLIPSPARAD